MFLSSFYVWVRGQDAASKRHHCRNTNVGSYGPWDRVEIMKNKRTKLLTLTTLLPLTVFASGGEVIEWLWIELFVGVGFVTTVAYVKLSLRGKGLMVLVFLVTEYLVIKLTDNMSYSSNKTTINSISIIVPILTTIASYWILRSRTKKEPN
jgi:hypothetical protein